jgi:predicted nucleic acid-binding protein
VKRLVVDASALAAIAFREPDCESLVEKLEGAVVYAPALLIFELASVAWKKIRRQPAQAKTILQALEAAVAEDRQIVWHHVDPSDVVLVAQSVGCSTYDAAYVWLAGTLGADLVTLDERMVRLTAQAEA